MNSDDNWLQPPDDGDGDGDSEEDNGDTADDNPWVDRDIQEWQAEKEG